MVMSLLNIISFFILSCTKSLLCSSLALFYILVYPRKTLCEYVNNRCWRRQKDNAKSKTMNIDLPWKIAFYDYYESYICSVLNAMCDWIVSQSWHLWQQFPSPTNELLSSEIMIVLYVHQWVLSQSSIFTVV